MAKKAQLNHPKPYEQKVAERNAAKRAMRTGGDANVTAPAAPAPQQVRRAAK